MAGNRRDRIESPSTGINSERWDVVVIGGGPSGSLAARECARRGAKVLLVDRAGFPRSKVCGSTINQRAMNALEESGLGGLPRRLGEHPMNRLTLRTGRAVGELPIGGFILSRTAFDAALLEEAREAGVEVLEQTSARVAREAGGTRSVILTRGQRRFKVTAKVVFCAAGLGAQPFVDPTEMPRRASRNSRIGIGALLPGNAVDLDQGEVLMCCGRQGYLGFARLEDGTIDGAAAVHPAMIKKSGGIGSAAKSIARECGIDLRCSEEANWKATPALTQRPMHPAAPRALLVGDAAGYVEPFTGEGIAWALESARLAAKSTMCALENETDPASDYVRAWQHAIGRRQRACRVVALALRSRAAVRLAVAAMNFRPTLFAPILARVNGHVR